MSTVGTKSTVVLLVVSLTASCTTPPRGGDPSQQGTNNNASPCNNTGRLIGALGGAVAGVLVAKALGGKAGAKVAAGVAGMMVGGLIGADIDRRRCEISKIAKAHNLDIEISDIAVRTNLQPASDVATASPRATQTAPKSDAKAETVGMSLTVFDRDTQFSKGSATPSPDAVVAFAQIANQYKTVATNKNPDAVAAATERTKEIRILLIGHTDDTGSSQANANLSEERARAIAKIFAQHGFSDGQIYYQGAGEVYPIADNRSDEGRARNRRVEIVDLSNDAAFESFLASRRPDVTRYRPNPPGESTTQIAAGSSSPRSAQPPSTPRTPRARAPADPANGVLPAPSASVKGSSPPASPVATALPPRGSSNSARATVPASPWDAVDFGGRPFDESTAVIDIGKQVQSSGFSLLPSAYAAHEGPIASCVSDHARISNAVKALDTGREIKTSEYLPGAASASWGGKVHGQLVGLTGVSVLRDGAQPAGRPTVFIWKNYKDGSRANPDLQTTGAVNAYEGDKALLYRVFPAEGPLRCIDIAISSAAPNTAPSSTIVYVRSSALYQSDFSPTITR